MTWATYGSYLLFAAVLVVIPGPDFAVVTKNTLAVGRRRGAWSAVGVASSNAVQGAAAAAGLGAIIVRYKPVFQAIKWAGIAYLLLLGVQSFRSAVAGKYQPVADGEAPATPGQGLAGWRQGFLSNITNPKVLVFYLAVLPQFLGPEATVAVLLAYALSHALLSLLYLLILVTELNKARRILTQRRVRRALDAATGTALLAFGGRLATDKA